MGSVKDLVVLLPPSREKAGRGRFIFSDRYSIFDWGEMPDHIDQKGASLCITAAYFFEKLEEAGIQTHYLGVVDDEQVKSLSQTDRPVCSLETKLYRVLEPELTGQKAYDYQIYSQESGNYLIPLEIIYRNALPAGSSIFKRLHQGELRLRDLNLSRMPREGMVLKHPYLDVSTKLESCDRYLSWQEAQEISGLSEDRIAEIKKLTVKINQIINQESKRIGLKNEDGKFEFALDEQRNVILVDVLGTLDECRFTYQEMPVSKEIARLFYRKSQWYQDLIKAKKKNQIHWKKSVLTKPEPLPSELKSLLSDLYCGYANEITGRKWFGGISSLSETLEKIKRYI